MILALSDGTYLVSNNTGDQSHYDRVVGALGNLATTGDIKATRRELESIFSHPTAAQVVTAARGVKGLAAFKAASVAPELTQQRYGGLEDDIGVIISGFEILGGRELVRSSRFVNDHGGKMHAEMRLLPQVFVVRF